MPNSTTIAGVATAEQVRLNPKPITIHDEIAETRAQLERLSQAWDRLIEKINPVLRDDPAAGAALEWAPQPGRSAVAAGMSDLRYQLESLTGAIGAVTDRVDLDEPAGPF